MTNRKYVGMGDGAQLSLERLRIIGHVPKKSLIEVSILLTNMLTQDICRQTGKTPKQVLEEIDNFFPEAIRNDPDEINKMFEKYTELIKTLLKKE